MKVAYIQITPSNSRQHTNSTRMPVGDKKYHTEQHAQKQSKHTYVCVSVSILRANPNAPTTGPAMLLWVTVRCHVSNPRPKSTKVGSCSPIPARTSVSSKYYRQSSRRRCTLRLTECGARLHQNIVQSKIFIFYAHTYISHHNTPKMCLQSSAVWGQGFGLPLTRLRDFHRHIHSQPERHQSVV